MSAEHKRGYGSTIALIALSLLALYGGVRWLIILIPIALLIRYLVCPSFREGSESTPMNDNKDEASQHPARTISNRAHRAMIL